MNSSMMPSMDLTMTDDMTPPPAIPHANQNDQMPAAARRALAEAEERRKQQQATETPVEIGGRGGADPARFGDWEINGRAIDF